MAPNYYDNCYGNITVSQWEYENKRQQQRDAEAERIMQRVRYLEDVNFELQHKLDIERGTYWPAPTSQKQKKQENNIKKLFAYRQMKNKLTEK